MKRGIFITLEGGEGGGKSTQVKLLKERLESAGHTVVVTREPGGTPEAEKIRGLLVDRAGGNWSPIAETLLLFAGRSMHVRDNIAPALAAGKIVICDRFTDSTRAYQGSGGGVAPAIIEEIKNLSIGDLEPDLTLILDLPVDAGLGRSIRRTASTGGSEDRFEQKEKDFHERLRQGFLSIARAHSERCKVIDATKSIEDVSEQIWTAVSKRLGA